MTKVQLAKELMNIFDVCTYQHYQEALNPWECDEEYDVFGKKEARDEILKLIQKEFKLWKEK